MGVSYLCGNGNCARKAVMNLIFGELAEIHKVPWCEKCVCPEYWLGDKFHHAEAIDSNSPKYVKVEKKEPQCTKCGEPANVAALGDMYCTPCYNAKTEKEMTIGEKVTALMGGAVKETADFIKENFIPKMPSSAGTLNTEDKVEQLTQEALTKALYNRQPHYEGGIDPITYGQDNFTPEEMNGFYKMNVIKYVSRCDRKNGLEDLKKAQDYLNLLIKSYEDAQPTPVGKRTGRKSPLIVDKWETEDLPLTEESEMVLREAELCVVAFHNWEEVTIKRKDVLKEVLKRLKGESYSHSQYSDGWHTLTKSE